jgi:parallel beta-helix repeat protein
VGSVGEAPASTGARGIDATATVSNCVVSQIGETAVTGGASGITGRVVTHCRLVSVKNTNGVQGISADKVDHCSVEGVNQYGGSGGAMGISAGHITDCQVNTVSASAAGNAVGFGNYRYASGCDAVAVNNGSTGNGVGFAASSGSQTLNCSTNFVDAFGILGATRCVVKGCNIQMDDAGTGISITGTTGVVENNTVTSATTGISITGTDGLVLRNTVRLCTTNFSLSATTQVGPIVSADGIIASTSPWANFTD